MSSVHASFIDGQVTVSDDAGHSATLALAEGDFNFEYDAQGGREVTFTQTRGAITGARRGARRLGKITMTAKLADPGAAFQMLAQGRTSGFVSTTADIGDVNAVDWSFSFPYGAQSRSYYGQDAVFGVIKITEGDPSTINFEADLIGPAYSNDSTNGTATLVGAR